MNELADYAWLTAPETAPVLAELADDDAPLHVQLNRLRKAHGPQRARLAVELLALRRKAPAKFGPFAEKMFFSDIGFQQSTDLWIAAYKASRFPVGQSCIDYCCGIGGDLLSLAKRGPTIGFDRSPEVCTLARANSRAVRRSENCDVRVAEVEECPPGVDTPWHIDPDRRSEGRRATQLQWLSPGPELIEAWLNAAPNAAIKLAPASEVPSHWQEQAELEWISRDRECRQQVAWFGSLAQSVGRRRATNIRHSNDSAEFEANCFEGDATDEAPLVGEVEQFVYDTDPAIRAAGLTGAFAEEHGLAAFSTGSGYLTGTAKTTHPLTSCFRVLDELPLREKTLGPYLRERDVGTLEIKKRGVDVDPEQLRKRLKLKGDANATLLLTRIGKREVALVCQRC